MHLTGIEVDLEEPEYCAPWHLDDRGRFMVPAQLRRWQDIARRIAYSDGQHAARKDLAEMFGARAVDGA